MNRLLRLFPLAALRRHTLLLATLLLTAPLLAETEGDFTYSVTNGQATITGLSTDYSGDLTIPDTLGSYPVTAIGETVFSYCSALTSVTIPESVTTIGEGAFYWCEALESVKIPSGVTLIDGSVFAGCRSLTSVEIPAGVTSIGQWAFDKCALSSVEIPEGVTSIGYGAFRGTALTAVTIPASVTSIGATAFGQCSSLDISVSEDNAYFSAQEGLLFDKTKTTLLAAPSVKGEYRVPKGVTTIGEGAFGWCYSLTSVTIPSGVTSIGEGAFHECGSLATVTFLGVPCKVQESSFPEGVTGYYPAAYAAEWEAEIVDGMWNGLVMKRLAAVEKPSVSGDEGATVEGSAETGWVVKPSEEAKVVVVSIPEGVEAGKVIVEVPSTATSVTANGAKVKVVKVIGDERHDITDCLDIPAAVAGKVDLTQAEVKAEFAEQILDTSAKGGAVFNPAAEKPLTTAKTKPGLTYILLEGDSLDSLTEVDRTVGNGETWTPKPPKRGASAFYRIRISK